MASPAVLIVEDDALIGWDLADLLGTAGYTVVGPYSTSDDAMAAAASGRFQLAILDVRLADGSTSEAVATALARNGTPIVFVSGYHGVGQDLSRAFPDAHQVNKPWDPVDLMRVVARATSRGDLAPTQ